jgi:hypothetical protein
MRCNAAMHRSILFIHSLPENRVQSANADFVQNFSDSRKKFIRRTELLSLEAAFEMPKQETSNNQRELSPASTVEVVDMVDVAQFARNFHRKTLLSLLLHVALHCPDARQTYFYLSLHVEQRSR